MKNKLYKMLVIVFYLLSFLILLYCIKIRLTPGIYLDTKVRLILLFLVCLFIYLSGFILVKYLNYTKKILKINLIIYFVIYTITICTLTLFDEIFGRQGIAFVDWDIDLLNMYIDSSFNIIPFKTIELFLFGYLKGYVSFKIFFINVFGNILAFMPYAIFIPLIFKKVNKYYKFLVIMVFIVLLIEFLQFITMSGSCDIDDLILNVFGASIVYFITKIKFINKFIHRMFLYE